MNNFINNFNDDNNDIKDNIIKHKKYNIESWSTKLTLLYPQFALNIKRGMDKNNRYIIHQMDNPNNSRYPLIITMYEQDGLYIDFGLRNNIIEAHHDFDKKVILIIDSILNDKAYSVCVFNDLNHFEKFFPSHTNFFINCDNKKFNNMEDFKKLILKLSKPVNNFKRHLTFYKGIIEITTWSGKSYKLLKR